MKIQNTRNIFLSESLADKVFGAEDPTGKTIEMFTESWNVKGVFYDVGSNAHTHFHLLQLDRERPYQEAYWGGYSHYTYLLLNDKADVAALEEKLKDFSTEFSPVSEKFSDAAYRWEIQLQSLASIHLHSRLEFEHEPNGTMQDIYMIIAIILMLMIISGFNYTNLLKLIQEERMQEFHIKKVFGASSFQLFKQHLLESLLFTLIALLLAGILIRLVMNFSGRDFGIEFYEGRNYAILLTIMLVFIMTHVLIPALLMVNREVLPLQKQQRSSENLGSGRGRWLAVPQFVISVILIALALTVYKQLKFLNEAGAGFSNEHVLTLSTMLPTSYAETGLERLKNTLQQHAQIKTLAFSETIPGEKFERDGSFQLVERPDETAEFCYIQLVSTAYFETFQIDLLAGKSFSENESSEALGVLINESLAERLQLSYEELIGKEASIPFENEYRTVTIRGVVKDYFHQSLRDNIEPCAYLNIKELPGVVSSISVRTDKVDGEELKRIAGLIQDTYANFFPADLATLAYAKDHYDSQFKKDYQFSNIINAITLISIFMTVLGFVGLASAYARSKTREVAIRKVYGANLSDVFSLFGSPYLKLMGITLLIAFPLSFYFVTLWLEYFVIKIDLGVWFAFWPILIISAISLLSFGYYVTKVVVQDPVKILKEH
ncbi:ABC transporter permease [Catalinimonas niigatensis]|uniref:ABC transporter permease n=1 Tax=Catalinimonas niigatensis TaxID=1397264 RepID=UPI002666BC88|nr:ABC transporter permease [Catalinimonas niigatensis]WPP52102.1 ABC transporter permease [Catalinimonas niigatensis]